MRDYTVKFKAQKFLKTSGTFDDDYGIFGEVCEEKDIELHTTQELSDRDLENMAEYLAKRGGYDNVRFVSSTLYYPDCNSAY